jgi:hypothetical protein
MEEGRADWLAAAGPTAGEIRERSLPAVGEDQCRQDRDMKYDKHQVHPITLSSMPFTYIRHSPAGR